jgi:AcrR family transcriptional regulator
MSKLKKTDTDQSSRAQQGEGTRDRIVLAAARLFARKGYSGTSIADISSDVEMTKGALYHHFAGKEAIFFAVVERIRSTWRSVVAREVVSTRDAVERLEILLDRQAKFLQTDETFCLVLNGLMSEMDGVNADFLGVLQDVYAELARFIEQIIVHGQQHGQIRPDLEPGLTALAIVGMLRGTGCSRPISERMRIDYAAMMDTLKKVVVKGLAV